MRILRPIIFAKPLLMPTGQSETSKRGGVGAQLVGDQKFRHKALLLEKLAHQQRRPTVASALDQHVENSPSSSTARQRYICSPAMRTTRRVARGSCIPALSQNRT